VNKATIAINDDSFETEIQNHDGVVLVDFWGENCTPCRQIAPSLEELAVQFSGKIKIAKANAEDAPGAFTRLGVRNVPCLIMFKNGQEVDRQVGYQPKSKLQSWIEGNT